MSTSRSRPLGDFAPGDRVQIHGGGQVEVGFRAGAEVHVHAGGTDFELSSATPATLVSTAEKRRTIRETGGDTDPLTGGA